MKLMLGLNPSSKMLIRKEFKVLPHGDGLNKNRAFEWHPLERLCLFYCYGNAPIKTIQTRLNRQKNTIKRKFYEFGYHKIDRTPFHLRKGEMQENQQSCLWGVEELEFLISVYGVLNLNQMRGWLDRSKKSISKKALELNLVDKCFVYNHSGRKVNFNGKKEDLYEKFSNQYNLSEDEFDLMVGKLLMKEYTLIGED